MEKNNRQRNLPLFLGSKQDLIPLPLGLKNVFLINLLSSLLKIKKISLFLNFSRFKEFFSLKNTYRKKLYNLYYIMDEQGGNSSAERTGNSKEDSPQKTIGEGSN